MSHEILPKFDIFRPTSIYAEAWNKAQAAAIDDDDIVVNTDASHAVPQS